MFRLRPPDLLLRLCHGPHSTPTAKISQIQHCVTGLHVDTGACFVVIVEIGILMHTTPIQYKIQTEASFKNIFASTRYHDRLRGDV